MTEWLTAAALLLLLLMAVSLVVLLRAANAADRLMAVQLLGTGSTALVVLLAVIEGEGALLDVALTLALLAACTTAALFASQTGTRADEPQERP